MTSEPCRHPDHVESICTVCGQCVHDVVLNGACFYCESTDLDPEKMSPKKQAPALIPLERLLRKP